MAFQEINNYLAPTGLIIIGLIIKFSKNKEFFGAFKNFWLFFVIIGVTLLFLKLFK
ncbi:hypothetical protein [Flavobacterium sp. UBA6195]|uniref:hypothetical protein n=1 Tax=Flavobacterium sp. UBA6195 TaxID=1946554 RepID=UPI0025BF3D8A|nr:hypothetical protein [Flavobacterium sp. UBA6195]